MHAYRWRKRHAYAAKDDSRMTPGPHPKWGLGRLPWHAAAVGRLDGCSEEEAVVDRVENTAGMGRRPQAEALNNVAEEEGPVPGLLPLCLSSAFPPLLSAVEASPWWGHGVQHRPTCPETLGFWGVRCTLGGRTGENRRKREERGKSSY